MKNKFLKIILPVVMIVTTLLLVYNQQFNIKGIYNKENEVYTNKYLNIKLINLPTFYVDESFSKSDNNGMINLFRIKNYITNSQEINDKIDIMIKAQKLNVDFQKYVNEFFDKEDKKDNVTSLSDIVKEGRYLTKEYKQGNWYYKVYLYKEKNYAVNISIKYTDNENKEVYQSYIDYIGKSK